MSTTIRNKLALRKYLLWQFNDYIFELDGFYLFKVFSGKYQYILFLDYNYYCILLTPMYYCYT